MHRLIGRARLITGFSLTVCVQIKFNVSVLKLIELGNINKKLLSGLADFGHSGGDGVWANPLKMKIREENILSIFLNKVLKICEKWYQLDVKANKSKKK